MIRRPKQTSIQRRDTDSQKLHEKMLSITNCQRNANHNYNEVSLHTSQSGFKKPTNNKCGEGVEKRTLLHCSVQSSHSVVSNSLRIPWTEESGRLQSMGSQIVRQNLATKPPLPPPTLPYISLPFIDCYLYPLAIIKL